MAQQGSENIADSQTVNQIQKPRRQSLVYPLRWISPEISDEDVPAISSIPVKNARRKRQSSPKPEPAKKKAKPTRAENLVEEVRKHERFWLADGNVVIELDGIHFRVHQSWLAQHSRRIAASLSDKGKSGDKFEQTKLNLRGKLKAIDFETLLLFYDNPGDYRHAIEPRTLMSLIRAATGLGFDSDRAWLVKELEALWPSSLEELTANPEPYLDALEVAVLARTCNIDGLLKPAFYNMARMPGFGLNKIKESEQIGPVDMLRLIRIREYSSDIWIQAAAHEDPAFVCRNLRDAPSSDSEGMSTPKQADEKPALGFIDIIASASAASTCLSVTARREAWARLVYDSGIFTRYRYDPLRGLAALINIEWTNDWCKDCKEKRKADWHTMQRSIWEKVGEYLRED
ncbi:uncharacterized protein F5891DRAFT_1010034 [Suillus fuscotomentosus]|uniref:BTB domain-containing protein n=1 Tax=Suillus fuscotomentosus TaxID=1912939 RepID=A0AAD4HQ60_9AGAM|nr:uncharacterized protein F5891DRAFT_1010034 [Suillus fuscotomentosus]KAG1904918.1 hypothetical protein F5891DRAFT_1010034 [Suillus fuscotomentosus]